MKRFNLALFRMRQGLTQSQMAQKLEISVSHYVGIENGFADPSYKVLCKFRDVFKDKHDDIFELFIKEKREGGKVE
jgi:putative transcriptional regulator